MSGGDLARRWWGWAEPRAHSGLSAAGAAMLERELRLSGPAAPRVELEDVELTEPRLEASVLGALAGVVGAAHVRDEREQRIVHAAGKSYADLIRLRRGDAAGAPDAIVYPADAAEVGRVLELCTAERIAVVPFGGGTSVVGGVEPHAAGFAGAISLDLARLDRLATDRRSLTATCGGGLPGRRAEARLQARGLTLGHFPQSYELATIGGYVATRSAGQASTGYGRIDKLVLGARLVTPSGELTLKPLPATAAGPSLLGLVLGSEGVLGVVSEATLAVRPLPDVRRYEGWSFPTFEDGVEALRELAQRHSAPDVARLSDPEETRLTLALSGGGSAAQRIGKLYLRARGHARGCIAITGFEGERAEVDARVRRAHAIMRAKRALTLGSRPGQAWLAGRYAAPYLRDELLDRGVLAETLETATTWTGLEELHAAVGSVLRGELVAAGTPPLVGCHVSHIYPAGASLYFTVLARALPGQELEQWARAKHAAGDAIEAHTATITHHHGVGREHVPWMAAEVGELGVDVLRAVKQRLDPAGVMNPGKLLPD